MNTNLTKMPARRRRDSGELDVFDASLYFSSGLDCVSIADRPAGWYSSNMPLIKTRPPPSQLLSPTPKLQQLCKEDKRSKQCSPQEKISKQSSSPGAKLANFVNSIFHQTKSRPKSTIISQGPKLLKTTPPLHHHITEKEVGGYGLCKKGINGLWLVHRPKSSDKGAKIFDEFKCRRVPNKGTDGFLMGNRIWVIDVLPSMGERRSFRRAEDQVDDDGGNCDHNSICSSDLFELENYDVCDISTGLPVYGGTDIGVIKRELVLSSMGERRSFRRAEDQVDDDGGNCDYNSICSSDLFELENYDVCDISTGLPVYGGTDIGVIKRELVL